MPRGAGTVTRPLDTLSLPSSGLGDYERSLGRTRTLESHASRVRKKLCIDADDRFIVNVWGVGYRILE
jgi:DNA-binding response OmpR family regulator